MAGSSLIDDVLGAAVKGLEKSAPAVKKPASGFNASELDDIMLDVTGLPPEQARLTGEAKAVQPNLTTSEAELKYYDSMEDSDTGSLEEFKRLQSVPSRAYLDRSATEWYDRVNAVPATKLSQRTRTSSNSFSSDVADEYIPDTAHWDGVEGPANFRDRAKAGDIQMTLDNRRFHPDRMLTGSQREKLWEYLGDDFLADPEGNPIVMFRTGSQLDSSGVPRAFGGEREFSAHMGARPAAMNVDDNGRIGFGGEGKVVDMYYTNIKNPLQVPEMANWAGHNVLSALVNMDGLDKKAKSGLIKTSTQYADFLRPMVRKAHEKNPSILGYTDINNASTYELFQYAEWLASQDRAIESTLERLEGSLSNDIKSVLEESGYDSIMYRNGHEGEGTMSFLPFRPESIKSIRNVGGFNPTDPNVLKSVTGAAVGTGAATQMVDSNESEI